jgi:hypothetical protein
MITKIEQAIRGERHQDYNRTKEVHEFSASMITGKNQSKKIKRYKPNEKMSLKEQRERLYNSPTKFVLARPRKYWKMLSKVPGKNVLVETKEEARRSELMEIVDNFNGQKLIDWLCEVLEFLGCVDPNAWIIYDRIDQRNADGSIAWTKIKPVIVPSSNVLDFAIVNGSVQYITFCEVYRDEKDGIQQDFENFFCFYPGGFSEAFEASDKSVQLYRTNPEYKLKFYDVKGKTRAFYIRGNVANGSKITPALQAGAYPDLETNMRTMVSWFDPASDVLEDLIRDKSLLDVEKIVHAFRKRFEYTKKCTAMNEQNQMCISGYYGGNRISENLCHHCGGTGNVSNHTSEQQVLTLTMPDRVENIVELSKLYHSEPVDISFPEWLEQSVERQEKRVMDAIFNSGIIEMASPQKTATETAYEYEDIYLTLEPFERALTKHWATVVLTMADYTDIPLVHAEIRFPKDKKMKSVGEILTDIEKGKAVGIGYDSIRVMYETLFQKMAEDNDAEVSRMLARLDWQPWNDKTESVIITILSGLEANNPDRILYENFNRIFSEIESENVNTPFYSMTREKQGKIIDQKIEKYGQMAAGQ